MTEPASSWPSSPTRATSVTHAGGAVAPGGVLEQAPPEASAAASRPPLAPATSGQAARPAAGASAALQPGIRDDAVLGVSPTLQRTSLLALPSMSSSALGQEALQHQQTEQATSAGRAVMAQPPPPPSPQPLPQPQPAALGLRTSASLPIQPAASGGVPQVGSAPASTGAAATTQVPPAQPQPQQAPHELVAAC